MDPRELNMPLIACSGPSQKNAGTAIDQLINPLGAAAAAASSLRRQSVFVLILSGAFFSSLSLFTLVPICSVSDHCGS